MAGRRILLPTRNPVLDADGLPVAGALIYFFTPGTNTPKTVYQDQALTTPHAHPIVADATGEYPSIWADEAEAFDFAIRDGAGAPVFGLRDLSNLTPSVAIGDGLLTATPAAQAAMSLSGVADRFPYYTGPSSAALTALTATARSFLALTTENDWLKRLGTFDTFADLAAATVPATVDYVIVAGHTTVNDGGLTRLVRVASEPSHPGKKQDASGAWFEFADDLWVEQFGAKGDNSTNDYQAIQDAISTAAAQKTGVAYLRGRQYRVNSTLTIGNGSTTVFADQEPVRLVGTGVPFFRQDELEPTVQGATRIRWGGSAGGTVIKHQGPGVFGCSLNKLILDGDNTADICLELISSSRATYDNFAVTGYRSRGIKITSVAATTVDTHTEDLLSGLLTFNDPIIWSSDYTSAASVCVEMSSPTSGPGVTHVVFNSPKTAIRRNGSVVFQCGFADQITIRDPINSCFDAIPGPDTTGAFLKLVGTNALSGAWPQNVRVTGNIDTGQVCEPVSLDTGSYQIGDGNIIEGVVTSLDQQKVLDNTAERHLSMGRVVPRVGSRPAGWVEIGNVAERARRNRFLNPGFDRNSRGATRTITAATGVIRLSDQWIIVTDATLTGTWTVSALSPGDDTLPESVRRYAALDLTTVTGGTYIYLTQRIEGVNTLEGKRAGLSVWAKAPSGSPTLSARGDQNFGTGGSPSTGVGVSLSLLSDSNTLTSSWSRYKWAGEVPTISGKTLGSNSNDYLAVAFSLALATQTIHLAGAQFEYGWPTAFEPIDAARNEAACARYLEVVGNGGMGYWFSTTQIACGAAFKATKRSASLSVEATGATITVVTPGVGTYTSSNPTPAVDTATAQGLVYTMSNFTGATAGNLGIVKTDGVLVSAEL